MSAAALDLEPTSDETIGTTRAGERRRVLIIEDDSELAGLIREELIEAGYEVTGIAGSAEGGLVLASKDPPQVAVVDIRLAGPNDGVFAAAELRRRHGTRILFVSGAADATTRERAQLIGPSGFLWKPFVPSQLLGAITRAGST